MKEIFKKLLVFFIKDRCWCEYEYLSSFPMKMQNSYLRKITIINEKCKKCWNIRQRKYFTDEI